MIYLRLFYEFFKTGLFAIGGGLATLPFLHAAVRLYREMGFYEIGCYNESPIETTIFMQYDL